MNTQDVFEKLFFEEKEKGDLVWTEYPQTIDEALEYTMKSSAIDDAGKGEVKPVVLAVILKFLGDMTLTQRLLLSEITGSNLNDPQDMYKYLLKVLAPALHNNPEKLMFFSLSSMKDDPDVASAVKKAIQEGEKDG